MFMRRRPLLRAAVVSGGAYLAGKNTARRRSEQEQQEAEQNARLRDLEQQAPASPSQAPGPTAVQSSPMVDQLNQLAALHQQGALSDDEFTAAKSKLFGT